jgi:hypothetical protein
MSMAARWTAVKELSVSLSCLAIDRQSMRHEDAFKELALNHRRCGRTGRVLAVVVAGVRLPP